MIFISYRRDDLSYTERLWDHLILQFGETNVFFDRDAGNSIARAREFPDAIEKGIQQAEIFLLVIGPKWGNEQNLARLKGEGDYVFLELKQALERRKNGEHLEILPLLTGNASMPEAKELPTELAELATLEAQPLHTGTEEYRENIQILLSFINNHSPSLRARQQNRWLTEALSSSEQSLSRLQQDIAVQAPTRRPIQRTEALASLNQWWDAWSQHHQAFVLLGEEGDGKSWATAEWLASKLNNSDFPIPVVFAPALRLASPSISEILAACLEQSQPTAANDWANRLNALTNQAPSEAPLFLLVVDAFNERTALDWRQLFDSLRAAPWRKRIALLALCRTPYWAHLGIRSDGLITTWKLPPFNGEELEQALAQRGRTSSQFDAEVLHLMARPRYFDLALRLHSEVEQGGLTLDRLIYEDWRDLTGRKRQRSCDHNEFLSLITELSERYAERRFTIPEFAQQAQGIADDIAGLRQELLSVRVLNDQRGGLALNPHHLPLGLGLVLANEVEESPSHEPSALSELIAKRMGSYREADLQVRICGIALFHALNTEDYPEAGRLALLRAWIEGRNLDDSDLETITTYLPLRPQAYLRMAEYIWGEGNSRAAQDAFMAGFLRYRQLPQVKNELLSAFTTWLGFVYPWGYRAYFEQDKDELEKARQAVEQRLGQKAIPGPAKLFGVTLQVVADGKLLRLAQVALAVLSHDHAAEAADALLTGIVACEVMEGSHADFPWVLRTCQQGVHQSLLLASHQLLATEKLTAKLAAKRLLAYLGCADARKLLKDIPPEQSSNNDDNGGLLANEDFQKFSDLSRNSPNVIAMDEGKRALDPSSCASPELSATLNDAGNGLNFSQIGCSMGYTVEQHQLEQIEPSLCAFAPHRYQELMRNLAQEMSNRDGLARKQLAWHLLEHAPVLGKSERDVILHTWRSALAVRDENNRIAELSLFPIVLLDLPAEEQWQLLIERGTAQGYWTRHAPSFRPLSAEHIPAIISTLNELPADATTQRNNLLWFLSTALRAPDRELRNLLLAWFDRFDGVTRAYCLEIFNNSDDAEAAQQVIDSGWRHRTGKDFAMENTQGSFLLATFGKALPFDDLIARISPEWLGYAVKARGFAPKEVALYAQILDTTWQHIYSSRLPEETETLSRYVRLKVDPSEERPTHSLSVTNTGSGNVRFANFTWGGSAGVGSSDDLEASTDPEAQIAKHNALAQQIADLANQEYDNGNPWFGHAFEDGDLSQVVASNDSLWRAWQAAVIRDDRQARQLLVLCRGFYEKLCTVLLTHAPAEGHELFKVIATNPGVSITEAHLSLPILLMDTFAAPLSPPVEELIRDHIDGGNSDMNLFESALLCQLGDKTDWMRQWANERLTSGDDYNRARGITLLGFSDAEKDGEALTDWITSTPDCWVRDVAELAQQKHQRNTWARCWFKRFLTHGDRLQAWAAFRLFLRCVDRRFWLWVKNSGLADAEAWKRDAVTMNLGAIESACKNNEKAWNDKFLGHSIKPNELWPWMKNYH